VRECPCTTKHVPKPIELVYESGYWLCPTTALNLRQLLDDYKEFGDTPPGSVTKHYSAYTRALAQTIRMC
jgi:hypothetical protein